MSTSVNGGSLIIGSLPHIHAQAALEALDRYPLSIPTWPQLPRRSFKESMISQYTQGLPAIVIDEGARRLWLQRDEQLVDGLAAFYESVLADQRHAFALTEEYAAALTPFVARLAQRDTKAPIVKGQVTGPFTFGLGLNDSEGTAAWFDETFRDVIVKGVMMKALWLAGQLAEHAQQVIIFFDEPILSALGTPSYIGIRDADVLSTFTELGAALHQEGVLIGVHCCGNMDWGLLARTPIDIISFDAFFFGDRLALYGAEMSAFLERGGTLAWGIVPTSDVDLLRDTDAVALKERMDGLIELYVERGFPESRLRANMMLTPSCGMGTLGMEETDTVLRLLGEIRMMVGD